MKAYETSATVQQQGDIRVLGVPFAPGTQVEVTIRAKRNTAGEFAEAWRRVTAELRNLPASESISDENIQKEIDDFRSGR